MVTLSNPALLLRWLQMTEREQMVWAVTFAQQTSPPLEAALIADQAVEHLRDLNIDESPAMEPEYEAARSGIHLDLLDFIPWYRVAQRLRHGHATSYQDPTTEDCQQAYERYRMGLNDFY